MKKFTFLFSLVLSLMITWATMILVFAGHGLAIGLIGIVGAVVVLLVQTLPSGGRRCLKDYAGRLLRWKTGISWYAIAILVPLAVEMAALAVFYLYGNVSLPLNPAYWNLPNLAEMLVKVLLVTTLAVIFSGFVLLHTPEKYGWLTKGLIFCLSLLVSMALLIAAAILSYGDNLWLFVGLIPAAFIALRIYERSGKYLLPAGLFLASFLGFELVSPVNWLLTGGFSEAMTTGAVLYFLIAALFIIADRRAFFPKLAGQPGLPMAIIALAAVMSIISIAFIISVNADMSYPLPTGPYKVGKVAYDWTDPDRPEIVTGNTTNRELMVYVWYPANVSGNAAESPVMDAETAAAVRPGDAFSLGFLKDLSDHTYQNVPMTTNQSPYPVLVMSHGDSSSPLLLSATAADLASHGYVVVGPSFTYNSRGTTFPDGRVIRRDYNYSLIGDDYLNFSLSYYDNAKQWAEHNADVERREADDVSFVLDQLQQLNRTDTLFMGKLDLGRVGAFGHSLGGAVSITSAETDDRIKAAADLDGALYHDTNITKPTMLLERGSRIGYNRSYDAVNQRLLTPAQFQEMKAIWDDSEYMVYANPSTAYYVGINGTEHENFMDFGPLGIPIDIGKIDGRYATRIIDAYLLAFFDKYLNGVDSPLLDGEQVYPEVVFKGHVNGTTVAY